MKNTLKLKLNKRTISSLNNEEMQKVQGGEAQICIKSTKKHCFLVITVSVSTRTDDPNSMVC